MNIAVLYQIYLSYLLPRAPDWHAVPYIQMMFTRGGHKVSVHPRRPDEPLFPNDVDRELSQMVVDISAATTKSIKDAPQSVAVKNLCFDRLEVVVFGDLASAAEIEKVEIIREYLDAAGWAANQFLAHCRVVARDPVIRGIEWRYNFNNQTYYLINPYTLTWFSEEGGQFKEYLKDTQGRVYQEASHGALALPVRKSVSITDVLDSFRQGRDPNLPLSLLVNARGLIETDSLREGVADLASACETASDLYLERKGKQNDQRAKSIIDRRVSFAERRYHLLTDYVDGRSLSRDDPQTFDLVEKTYQTRNSLVHAGEMGYRSGRRRPLIPVERPR